MGRRVPSGLAALCVALAVPAAATANVVAPAIHVTVRPAAIHPTTPVSVSFRQPQPGGLLPDVRVVETLHVSGPAHTSGCIHSVAMDLKAVRAGRMVHRTMRPGNVTHWCLGRFRGQVTLAQTPICNPGPVKTRVHACPMYVIAPRTIATFSFRVTAP